jgi:CHAD domain-containing protein
MPIAADKLVSLPSKLRKSIKQISRDPTPDRVHKLRTRSRRLESALKALSLDSRKNERGLIKAIKPIRRRAGRVRDMDVLTQFASDSHVSGEQECSVRLLEYLGSVRERQSDKLQKKVDAERANIRRRLKKSTHLLETQVPIQRNRKPNAKFQKLATEAAARSLSLEGELRKWPNLTRANLHRFRLKVKKLRYILQMAEESNGEFVASLGEVKDAIGEWHDWEELARIAKQVIQHPGCKLVVQIRSTAQQKFEHALFSANSMRRRFLQPAGRRKFPSGTSRAPALASVSAIAA